MKSSSAEKSFHTQSTCTLPQLYVFSDALSNFVDAKNSYHTNYMNVASPLHELSSVSSKLKPIKTFDTDPH